MRLDVFLTEYEFYESRTRAVRAIKEGLVRVGGKVINKPSFEVNCDDNVEAGNDPIPYVGRGALKLKGALEAFNIDISGLTVVDIGASTGGFTEIMLLAGAEKVFAVDVGHSQLAEKLKNDTRVINLEGTDVRSLFDAGYGDFFDFAACDASFISLSKILPAAVKIIKPGARGVFLIKPQFEVGKQFVSKNGIVKDQNAIKEAIRKVSSFAESCGFVLEAPIIPSPIKGGDGNSEFLMLVKRTV